MVLLGVMVVTTVGVFGYGMLQQLVLGRPWGDRPMSDLALMLVGSASILLVSGIAYLLYTARLITEARPDALYLRFFPLSQRRIPWSDVASCQARTYRPIREYGGWGIRFGRGGMAYNVSGDRGVQLELRRSKALLVGSQRAEQLASIIQAILRDSRDN
jgi:hypothetical protein